MKKNEFSWCFHLLPPEIVVIKSQLLLLSGCHFLCFPFIRSLSHFFVSKFLPSVPLITDTVTIMYQSASSIKQQLLVNFGIKNEQGMIVRQAQPVANQQSTTGTNGTNSTPKKKKSKVKKVKQPNYNRLPLPCEMNSDSRKFECSFGCGKRFQSNYHVKRHEAVHTGEKKYSCHLCEYKCYQTNHLDRHLIRMHTKKYPYYCPTCTQGFIGPGELDRHIERNGHG